MPTGPVEVQWELAADPRFADVLQRGSQRTDAELGYGVHVRPVGLPAGREYWYRFRVGSGPTAEISPAGRTRTAPAPGELGALTLCLTSCARYEHGLFTAYRRLAEDNPDLVVALGDHLRVRRRRDRRAGAAGRRRRGPHACRLSTALRAVPRRPRPAGRACRRTLGGGV